MTTVDYVCWWCSLSHETSSWLLARWLISPLSFLWLWQDVLKINDCKLKEVTEAESIHRVKWRHRKRSPSCGSTRRTVWSYVTITLCIMFSDTFPGLFVDFYIEWSWTCWCRQTMLGGWCRRLLLLLLVMLSRHDTGAERHHSLSANQSSAASSQLITDRQQDAAYPLRLKPGWNICHFLYTTAELIIILSLWTNAFTKCSNDTKLNSLVFAGWEYFPRATR